MAQNREPIFIDVPYTNVATVAAIPVGRSPSDISGMELLVSAGSDGALVESVKTVPLGSNAETVLRLFYVISEGAVPGLLTELKLEAVSANATTALPENTVQLPIVLVGDIGNRGLRMSPGSFLYAALSVAVDSGYNIVASGGYY